MPDVYKFGDARGVVATLSLSRDGLEFLLSCVKAHYPGDGFCQKLHDALNEVDRRRDLRDFIENDQNKEDDLRDEAKRDAMLDVLEQGKRTIKEPPKPRPASVADLDMRDRFLS